MTNIEAGRHYDAHKDAVHSVSALLRFLSQLRIVPFTESFQGMYNIARYHKRVMIAKLEEDMNG